MVKPQLALVTALLLLASGVAAQEQVQPTTNTVLGEDILSYNFVMRGLPGSSQEEVEADRSFEREADSDESYNLTEDDALEVARDELGSSEWNVEDSERSEGLYELSFVRGESEAEVSVDGSSGRIVEFEAEVEWEPENEEPSAVLSGFIQFSREGYEVDTDIGVDEENSEASFEVVIEEEDLGAERITREEIREFEDAAPGSYTGRLEVVRDDEVIHTEEQEFTVPGPAENESEDEESEETEEDESEEESGQDESEQNESEGQSLEEMSKEELIQEIRDLREELQSLRDEASNSQQDQSDQAEPDSETEEPENETESEEEQESGEDESEEDSENESESSGPEGTPGNSEDRPSFVNRMLSGLFG